MNLAVTLAQLGDKTLLIDGDLQKPESAGRRNMGDGKYAGLIPIWPASRRSIW